MGKYSDQPSTEGCTHETVTNCPFCDAKNIIKYLPGKIAKYECHSCYSEILVLIDISRLPGDIFVRDET